MAVSRIGLTVVYKPITGDGHGFERTASEKAKPIIFIAHSLGGIVVKDALSLSRNEETVFSEILPATAGVLFLGTPHHGSKIASLGKIAFELSKVALKSPNLQVLRGLEPNSEILERISRSFGQILATGRLKVHSFREELDTKGIMIVDSFSATIGYLIETRGSLHANHRDMAKFTSIDDTKFQRVVSVLRQWVDQMGGTQLWQKTPIKLDDNALNLPDGLIFDENYQLCLQSLNFAEARRRLETVEDQYEGTYVWLLNDELDFKGWLKGSNNNPIYWIRGKPGSGKSTAMKFALTHPSTRELLESYNNTSCIVASYFFHDRGTNAQKSTEGFLREILFQILHQRKDLFASVYPVFTQLRDTNSSRRALEKERSTFDSSTWSIGQLRGALESIRARAAANVNICLFVDALDEHDGNHRELISILVGLTQLADNTFFRMRLCLSGRPENIYKDAFRTCPGFAIHELTTGDVRVYAEGRLQTSMRGSLTDKGAQELDTLIDTIIAKAEGVFMWVRLVIDELVEGLCEGDSIEELQNLLSTIPIELCELYTRAIRRNRRASPQMQASTKHEAFVMFQIATYCREPFTLYEFLSATLFLTTGKGTYPDLQRLSEDQMERRLYSRSAGLLEAPYTSASFVQFIHQTVKEYMLSSEGHLVTREGVGNSNQESGHILILRYLISLTQCFESMDVDEQTFLTRNFLYYAQAVELHEGICVAESLEPTILKMSQQHQHQILTRIILNKHERPPLANILFDLHHRHRGQLLVFYVLCSLPLSLKHSLALIETSVAENDVYNLLKAALLTGYEIRIAPSREQYSPAVEILLESGIANGLSDHSIQSLDEVAKAWGPNARESSAWRRRIPR